MSSWEIDEGLLEQTLEDWKAEHHPDFMSRRAVRRFIRWLPRDPMGYGTPDPRWDHVWFADVGEGWIVMYALHPDQGMISVTSITPTPEDPGR